MGRNKSAIEEVRDEHLRVLGPELGPLYYVLCSEVTWLHVKWAEHRKLYGNSPERVALLNEIAGLFFRVVQDVLWEDALLHLARLVGPPKSAGKRNLTINRLAKAISEPVLKSQVEKLVEIAKTRCSFATEWRNRHLAHRDLELAMESPQAKPLPPASRQKVEDALAALAAVLNRIQVHYFGTDTEFDPFLTADDAETLVHHLVVATRCEERKRERFRQGKLLPEDLE
jgi:hypothetical protein